MINEAAIDPGGLPWGKIGNTYFSLWKDKKSHQIKKRDKLAERIRCLNTILDRAINHKSYGCTKVFHTVESPNKNGKSTIFQYFESKCLLKNNGR
jgi:hypothetical protein